MLEVSSSSFTQEERVLTDLGIKQRRVGNVTVLDTDSGLRIALKFGRSSVPFEKAIESLLSSGQRDILLNLGGVKSMNAKGVGELISIFIEVKNRGGQFKLFNLAPMIRELMSTTNLSAVFELYENEGEAIESFNHAVSAANQNGVKT